ncbi:MAG: CrcB family protein [Caldilineaceae bacterium]
MQMLKNVFLVMLGGGIGAVVREALILVVPELPGASEASIFVANMTAALLIGLTTGLAVKGGIIGPAGKLLIATGIMGGLSTFSSFVWGADNMLADPSLRLRGLLFIGASMVFGFLLAKLGLWIGQRVVSGRRLAENVNR